MANDLTTGSPLFFDTAGATSEVANPVRLGAVVVYATAADWDVVIHDVASGKVIFQAYGVTKDSFVFDFPEFMVSTLYVTTLTNCKALVYTR